MSLNTFFVSLGITIDVQIGFIYFLNFDFILVHQFNKKIYVFADIQTYSCFRRLNILVKIFFLNT